MVFASKGGNVSFTSWPSLIKLPPYPSPAPPTRLYVSLHLNLYWPFMHSIINMTQPYKWNPWLKIPIVDSDNIHCSITVVYISFQNLFYYLDESCIKQAPTNKKGKYCLLKMLYTSRFTLKTLLRDMRFWSPETWGCLKEVDCINTEIQTFEWKLCVYFAENLPLRNNNGYNFRLIQRLLLHSI